MKRAFSIKGHRQEKGCLPVIPLVGDYLCKTVMIRGNFVATLVELYRVCQSFVCQTSKEWFLYLWWERGWSVFVENYYYGFKGVGRRINFLIFFLIFWTTNIWKCCKNYIFGFNKWVGRDGDIFWIFIVVLLWIIYL